jgi:hypothetical protein
VRPGDIVEAHDADWSRRQRLLGRVGAVLLLLIIPVKLVRHLGAAGQIVVGVAPSVLGPAGFFFLLVSSPGRLSRLTLGQMGMVVGAVSVGLELLQLLPRPGILARVRYTFDVLDLLATLFSAGAAYAVARAVLRGRGTARGAGAGRS